MPVEFKSVLGEALNLARHELSLAAETLAEGAAAHMVGHMEDAKHGRPYPSRKRDGSIHIASAPGEAPGIDLGEYAESVQVVNAGGGEWSVWSGEIGSYLEDGTTRIQPRPHIAPAFEMSERVAELVIATAAAEIEKVHI